MKTVNQGQQRQRAGDMLGQLVRFAITGGFVTMLYAIVYWPLATYVIHPMAAFVAGYLVALTTGYVLHSRWSFRGHGSRDDIRRTTGRFFAVSLVSFALNGLFTWVLTGPLLHGATWWPLIPIFFFTPLVTFALNRLWVFA
ncbi:GtrA family protein [Sphingomonas sp. 28-62-20]|uniref:GtrA family protein n=1 Tax=Sphingomonas sp. 28-62-20 TaxID=1970433 RepID=UPI0035A86FE7